MMMLNVVLLSLGMFYSDAYIICGPKPEHQCLVEVNQCLTEAYARGMENDLAFEYCSEWVDPRIVH